MRIVTVLRVGKDYKPQHAQWLHKQLRNYDLDSLCLTDAGRISGVSTVPLLYDWPGWWAKIELFNPEHPIIGDDDIFYIDIDTVIWNDIRELFTVKQFTMLSDFYHPDSPASGVMYIPKSIKYLVWETFIRNSSDFINKKREPPHHGDQGFLSQVIPNIQRWQDIFPGKIVSYKKDIFAGDGSVPDCNIICFHGNPRPWKAKCSWVPPLSKFSLLKKLIFRYHTR